MREMRLSMSVRKILVNLGLGPTHAAGRHADVHPHINDSQVNGALEPNATNELRN